MMSPAVAGSLGSQSRSVVSLLVGTALVSGGGDERLDGCPQLGLKAPQDIASQILTDNQFNSDCISIVNGVVPVPSLLYLYPIINH